MRMSWSKGRAREETVGTSCESGARSTRVHQQPVWRRRGEEDEVDLDWTRLSPFGLDLLVSTLRADSWGPLNPPTAPSTHVHGQRRLARTVSPLVSPSAPPRRRPHVVPRRSASVPPARALPHPRASDPPEQTRDTVHALAAHPAPRPALLPASCPTHTTRHGSSRSLRLSDSPAQGTHLDRVPRDVPDGRQSRPQVRARRARPPARGRRGLCQPARRWRSPHSDVLGHL